MCYFACMSGAGRGAALSPSGQPTGVSVVPARKQLDAAKRLMKDFDWSKVDAMTDEAIVRAAKSDPDSALPDDEALAEFDLVLPPKSRKPPAAAE